MADVLNITLVEAVNQALAYAYKNSVLLVAAAGNDSSLEGSDLATTPVYPVCNDGSENMILGVAALDAKDKKALFSNLTSASEYNLRDSG